MKILSVVGARPEFIQSMPLSRILRKSHQEVLVHTGQHYDAMMSQVFFEDLEIPAPAYNLGVGSGSHAQQTGNVLVRLEEVLLVERPDLMIIRGDTNSTLAGALAAAKLNVPIAHIEAGERSFNRRMPEEVNRLVADRLATLLFCASENAVEQLAREGITEGVYYTGDVMLDALLLTLPVARERSKVLERFSLVSKGYSLVTVHRSGNTDDPLRLGKIIAGLNQVDEAIVFPVHPRARMAMSALHLRTGEHIHLVDPLSYLDMIALEENARLIATDSGGVQREAYFLGIPCLTLRDETEWVSTITAGWNQLAGVDPERISAAWFSFRPASDHPPLFGDGQAARRIASVLDGWERGRRLPDLTSRGGIQFEAVSPQGFVA